MIRVVIWFKDGSSQAIVGRSFQHGERALVVNTDNSLVGVPVDLIRIYEVTKHEEPKKENPKSDGPTAEDKDIPVEGDTEQEALFAKEEEAP